MPRLRWLMLCCLPLLAGCAGLDRWSAAAGLVADVADPATAARPPHPGTLTFTVSERRYLADLYRPEGRPRAALVLVHGFAKALAGAGLLVLAPTIDSLTRFQVGTANVVAVRDALAYLAARGESRQLGVGAISYAVGPALLAALRLSDEVDFVLAVGGYYDLVETVTFATTGYYRVEDGWRYRPPASLGRWLLLLGHAHHLPDPRDRELLRRIARARLADPDAAVGALRRRLSEQGEAAYALVANRDPRRVERLVGRLPAPMQRQFTALDLSRRDLATLEACLVLIHGRDDPMIPPTQSVDLAAAVAPGRAALFVVGGIGHVDVRPGWRDALSLWRAAATLIRAAEEC